MEGERGSRHVVRRRLGEMSLIFNDPIPWETETLMTIIPCLKNPRSFDQSCSFYVKRFQAPDKLEIKIMEELAGRGRGDSASSKSGASFWFTLFIYNILIVITCFLSKMQNCMTRPRWV